MTTPQENLVGGAADMQDLLVAAFIVPAAMRSRMRFTSLINIAI
jgi:hypothetical protein